MYEIAHAYSYQMVAPKLLKVDPMYQRPIDQNRVQRIVKEFNRDLFNEPKVSLRADGFYYIFDGDHSIAAHKIKFGEDTPILCKVYNGLTADEEANLFVNQNGISRMPSANDKLRARYNMKDPEIVDMVICAKMCGVEINFEPGVVPAQNRIVAIRAAYSVYKQVGHDNFINIVHVISKTWNGESISFNQGMLKGLGYVYQKHSNLFSNDKLINSLKMRSPDFFIREAADGHGTLARRFAKVIIKVYNYKRSTGRLPELD